MAEILVVDDSSLIRSELESSLNENGFEISIAESGVQALEVFKCDLAVKLIITDYNMPEMNGIELVEEVRRSEYNNAVKILVMSTETNTSLKQRCKELHISGWILKPLNMQALLPVIKRLVG